MALARRKPGAGLASARTPKKAVSVPPQSKMAAGHARSRPVQPLCHTRWREILECAVPSAAKAALSGRRCSNTLSHCLRTSSMSPSSPCLQAKSGVGAAALQGGRWSKPVEARLMAPVVGISRHIAGSIAVGKIKRSPGCQKSVPTQNVHRSN
jgi:hypothetical protein